jgi:signal peptidase II
MVAIIIIAVLLVLIDQATKFIVIQKLMPIVNKDIINNFFSLTYVENRGAAFGSMQGARWFFIAITLVVVVLSFVYLARLQKKGSTKRLGMLNCSVVLIMGGAMGNFIDRLFRGYVVDFLNFNIFGYDFPVFNFADICVVCGAVLLLIWAFFVDEKTSKKG